MTYEYAVNREELIQYINKRKQYMMGSATREGMLYQEVPFAGYEELPVHRTHSAKRVQLVSDCLELSGKKVLDIGCNIGYFCFEFARLGATCWGIDYDIDAIFVAQSLKHIHGIENVHFSTRTLSTETISWLLSQAGQFDVILLNSVVHWLLYNNLGAIRRVANLLNQLSSPQKQYIVYEPSSSNRAYYPEELTESGVNRFFRLLGVSSYRRIGTLFTSNIDSKREVWLGERDIHATICEIDSLLTQQQPIVSRKKDQLHVVYTKRDKICLRYGDLFIKTAVTANSNSNFLLRNELAAARKLACYAEYTPVLIVGTEFGGRVYLVYEWIEGHLLAKTLVTKRDISWISRELIHFLHILEWVDLAHNDLRPHNVFLLPKSETILVIDCEHSGPRFALANRPEQPNQWLLERPTSAEEKRILVEQLSILGGEWRSPYGVGCYENDYYAINKMIFDLKNRRKYARRILIRARNWLRYQLATTRLGRQLSALRRSSVAVE